MPLGPTLPRGRSSCTEYSRMSLIAGRCVDDIAVRRLGVHECGIVSSRCQTVTAVPVANCDGVLVINRRLLDGQRRWRFTERTGYVAPFSFLRSAPMAVTQGCAER